MSGHHHGQGQSSSYDGDEDFGFSSAFPAEPAQQQHIQLPFDQHQLALTGQHFDNTSYQPMPIYNEGHHYPYDSTSNHVGAWATPIVPSNVPPEQPFEVASFPHYADPAEFSHNTPAAGPSTIPAGYLSPDEARLPRSSRATSFTSNFSSVPSMEPSDVSRSGSPNASEMANWGEQNENGSWRCRYPGCTSRSTFNRGCDLRKHYKRHTKSLFCRHVGCPQATTGGFSSKKDRARHEAKHNPNIACEFESCPRKFSRLDNMKDHVRRMHRPAVSE